MKLFLTGFFLSVVAQVTFGHKNFNFLDIGKVDLPLEEADFDLLNWGKN